MSEGIKNDQDKPPMDLLDKTALIEIAKVMGFGAKKYSAHNWRGGLAWSRVIAAALRHLTSFNDGVDLDPETGLSHLAHAGCCIMFLLNYVKTHPELDDRYKKASSDDKDYIKSSSANVKTTSTELKFEEVQPGHWKDLTSGLVWGPVEEGRYTYDKAISKFGDKLPTKEEFEEAEEHGFREVLPGIKDRWFWSSSVRPNSSYYAFGFDGNFGYVGSYNRSLGGKVRCVCRPSA